MKRAEFCQYRTKDASGRFSFPQKRGRSGPARICGFPLRRKYGMMPLYKYTDTAIRIIRAMKQTRVNIFDPSKRPIQVIAMLAWPIFLEQIFATLASYANTAMVGSLGAYATASVTLCNPAMFLITGTVLAMGVGITALVARNIGAGDIEGTRRLVRQAILIIVFLGFPFCVLYAALYRVIPQILGAGPDILEYAATYNLIVAAGRPFGMAQMVLSSVFRGAGDTKTPLRINLFISAFNVAGNYFLVYETHRANLFGLAFTVPGAGWGVAGAATATAVSMLIGGLLSAYILFAKPSVIQISLRDSFRIDWGIIRRITWISLPAIFERVSTQSASMLVTSTIASLGTVTLAANSLYNTAQSIVFMPAFAVSAAATTLVGQFLGAKQPDNAQSFVYRICRYSLVIFSAMGLALYLAAAPLIGVFTDDTQVIPLAASCLRIVAFIQPVQALSFVFAGALRGAADTKATMVIIALTNWLFSVGATVVCVKAFGLGLIAACLCMCADLTLRAILFFFRFRSGKWKTALREE